jgi:glutamine amidotransferase PdxT
MGCGVANVPKELELTGFKNCVGALRTINRNRVSRDNQHSAQLMHCDVRRQVFGDLVDLFKIDQQFGLDLSAVPGSACFRKTPWIACLV